MTICHGAEFGDSSSLNVTALVCPSSVPRMVICSPRSARSEPAVLGPQKPTPPQQEVREPRFFWANRLANETSEGAEPPHQPHPHFREKPDAISGDDHRSACWHSPKGRFVPFRTLGRVGTVHHRIVLTFPSPAAEQSDSSLPEEEFGALTEGGARGRTPSAQCGLRGGHYPGEGGLSGPAREYYEERRPRPW